MRLIKKQNSFKYIH